MEPSEIYSSTRVDNNHYSFSLRKLQTYEGEHN